MKVQHISNYNIYRTNNYTQKRTNTGLEATSPSFGNYKEVFAKAMTQSVRSHDELCTLFSRLFKVAQDNAAFTSACCKFFAGIIANASVYTLFTSLHNYENSSAPEKCKEYIKNASEHSEILARDKSGKELVTYDTTDMKYTSTNYTAQKPAIRFKSLLDRSFIEFTMDKHGDLVLDRFTEDGGKIEHFYYKGGLKKEGTYEQYKSADNIYYNKDGSKAFWRNLFCFF